MKEEQNQETKLAVMANDIGHIKIDIVEIKRLFKDLSTNYVTKSEFEPVKKLVYGLVALILTSVVLAILAVVIL